MSMSQAMGLLTSRKTVEWYTPPAIIERARSVLGTIDLDPASNDIAQQWIKATTYYTGETLLQPPWEGRVWLNPPFDDAQAWIDRLELAYNAGDVTAAVLLVNSAPGYDWWEALIRRHPVCLVRDRVRFWTVAGEPAEDAAKKGTTIVYYGPDVGRFIDAFDDLGLILQVQKCRAAA